MSNASRCLSLVICFVGFADGVAGQTSARDSAAVAAAIADSVAELGTADAFSRSIPYRHHALTLYRKIGSRPDESTQIHRLSIAFYQLGIADSAMHYSRMALSLRRELGDLRGEIRSLNNIGVLYDQGGNPDSALAYYRMARQRARELGDAAEEAGLVLNLGVLYQGLGNVDSALAAYREASVLAEKGGDRVSQGMVENNIADLLKDLGQRDSALVQATRALAIAREIRHGMLEASANLTIGVIYKEGSETDSSIAYTRRALAVFDSLGNAAGAAKALRNLGIAFDILGQRDSALIALRGAAQAARLANDQSDLSATYANLGVLYRNVQQADSAFHYLRLALDLKRTIRDQRGEAIALANLAVIHAENGGLDSAEVYGRASLTRARGIQLRTLEATALNVIASVFMLRAQYDSALGYYSQDLAISREVGDRAGAAKTLEAIGNTLDVRGNSASAVAYYDSAAALQAWVSQRVGGDFNRLTSAEDQTHLFERWGKAWLARAPTIGQRSAALATLAAAERGRAQALLDLMLDTVTTVAPGADLVAEGERLTKTATSDGTTVLSYVLWRDTLMLTAALADGRIATARVPISSDSLAALVLRYRAALGVARPTMDTRELHLERGAVAVAPTGNWRSIGASLARVLVPDSIAALLSSSRDVLIVPQGSVALVPFTSLPAGRRGAVLGDRLAIRYAPSLATAQVAAKDAPTALNLPSAPAALVVGNPSMPSVPSSSGARVVLPALPGAERESKTIARLLGVQPLGGADATEAEVRRRLTSAPIVHLATHGFAYSAEAMARHSYVALAADNAHDGLLTVAEILDDPAMQMNAGLVVLSACQTGLGNLRQAEGTVGFQRALLARGVRSVLVSLWSVSDEATSLLMESFYKHWLRDRDRPAKAEALRRAQNDVRRVPRFSHPRFWAAFQVVGAR